MFKIKRDGVALAYWDMCDDAGAAPLLFVHGWGCDHTTFKQQSEVLRKTHRVVMPDLRGHGESDAPVQDYTIGLFAEDIAWLIDELHLDQPVVVGHSMGGNIAIELAARYPMSVQSIVLIDSVLFPPERLLEQLTTLIDPIRDEKFRENYRSAINSLCLPSDDAQLKKELLAWLPRAPQHVLVSALTDQLIKRDMRSAATGCMVDVAYIGAATRLANLIEPKTLMPQVLTAQTLGSGHFSTVFVPDQINAMIRHFLELSRRGMSSGGRERPSMDNTAVYM